MFQLKAEISNHPRVVSQQVDLLSPFSFYISRSYLIQLSLNMIVYDDNIGIMVHVKVKKLYNQLYIYTKGLFINDVITFGG